MIRVRFSPAAQRDLVEARAWYSEISLDLDKRLGDEIDRVLRRLALHPESAPLVATSTRRANLLGFPYSIFYVRRQRDLLVTAFLHHARHPRTWRRRT